MLVARNRSSFLLLHDWQTVSGAQLPEPQHCGPGTASQLGKALNVILPPQLGVVFLSSLGTKVWLSSSALALPKFL